MSDPKKLDDSLFEDVPYQAAPADDDLFEDVPHPDHAPVVEAKEADPFTQGLKAIGGAALGSGVNEAAKFTGNLIHNNMGDLDKNQIKMIADNAKDYKKAAPLQNILDQFRDLGDRVRQGGIDDATKAREMLKGKPGVPVSVLNDIVAKTIKNDRVTKEMAQGTKEKVLGQELDLAKPETLKLSQELSDVEKLIEAPPLDERFSIRKNFDDQNFNRKLEQLSTPMPENKKLPIVDSFEADKNTQKLKQMEDTLAQVKGQNVVPQTNAKDDLLFNNENRLDRDAKLRAIDDSREIKPDYEKLEVKEEFNTKKLEKQLERKDDGIAKAQKKIEDLSQKMEQKMSKFQQDLANKTEKNSALRTIDTQNAQVKTSSQIEQVKYTKLKKDEKAAELAKLKQKEKMENLLAQKAKIEEAFAKSQEKIQTKAKEGFAKKQQIPESIISTDPKFFGNRKLADSYVEPVAAALRETEDLDKITPERLGTFLRETRDEKVQYGQGGEINNFNKDLSNEVSEKLKEIDEDYRVGMEKSAASRLPQDRFEGLGINYNDTTKETQLGDSGRAKITRALNDPDKSVDTRRELEKALKESEELGHLPKGTTVDSIMKEAELSALKSDVNSLRQGKAINAFDINSIAKGEVSRAPGIMSKLGGTRLQELLAQFKGSAAGKVLKQTGNYGAPIISGLAASMSAASAASEGRINPVEAASLTMAENVNPTSLDLVEGYAQGKEGAQAASDDYKSSQEYWDKADGSVPLENTVKGALKGAGKGLAAATEEGFLRNPNAQMGANNPLAGGLIDASEGDYADAEKQLLEIRKGRAEKKSEAPHEQFKSFVEQRPEQIQELAQLFSGDDKTASFVAPLEKAASADERTKSAVLFGLYQQPAFRQAMKAKKGM